MKAGDRYNWKGQPERLIYLGLCEPRNGRWHQFAKVDSPTVVWCEVLDGDLHMLEATKATGRDGMILLPLEPQPQRTPDYHVADHGSICILNPISPECIAWVDAHVGNAETQHWGKHGVVVEPRYLGDIIEGLTDAGFQA